MKNFRKYKSFKYKKDANSLKKKLKKQGYRVRVKPIKRHKGTTANTNYDVLIK